MLTCCNDRPSDPMPLLGVLLAGDTLSVAGVWASCWVGGSLSPFDDCIFARIAGSGFLDWIVAVNFLSDVGIDSTSCCAIEVGLNGVVCVAVRGACSMVDCTGSSTALGSSKFVGLRAAFPPSDSFNFSARFAALRSNRLCFCRVRNAAMSSLHARIKSLRVRAGGPYATFRFALPELVVSLSAELSPGGRIAFSRTSEAAVTSALLFGNAFGVCVFMSIRTSVSLVSGLNRTLISP